jgi:flagella basal body P-ring formation protein FlgA
MLPIAYMLAAGLSGAVMMAPEVLAARVEAFSGAAAMVDPRLILPDCAAPQLEWAGPRSVSVRCAAPMWQVFVAVQGENAGPAVVQVRENNGAPLVRRGDRVVVEVGGEGWLVAVEGVAEADARGDRVMVKAGNKRLAGVIGPDGHVRIR